MKKPNAIEHMMAYGLVYGFLSATLFFGSVALIKNGNMLDLGLGANIGLAALAIISGLFVGLGLGLVLGLINGFILWFFSLIELPLNQSQMNIRAVIAAVFIAILTIEAMSFITLPLASKFATTSRDMLLLSLPIPIAAGSAMYAVHRYMLKLRTWANVGKAKNEHKLKNQLADSASTVDAAPISEADSQVNQLRH